MQQWFSYTLTKGTTITLKKEYKIIPVTAMSLNDTHLKGGGVENISLQKLSEQKRSRDGGLKGEGEPKDNNFLY